MDPGRPAHRWSARSTDRSNHFGLLRLLFAGFVLFTHAYDLSGGSEPLRSITDGQLTPSWLGVYGFFIISGFLVWRSMMKTAGPVNYLAKRALRIYPALILVVMITVCALGPVITTLPGDRYWNDPLTWRYLLNPISMLRGGVTFRLPGVFTTSPITSVNGSLWTIPYELLCYLLLLAAFPLKERPTTLAVVLVAVYLAACLLHFTAPPGTIPHTSFSYRQILNIAPYFLGGCVIACFRWEIFLARKGSFAAAFAIALLALALGDLAGVLPWLLPVLVVGGAHLGSRKTDPPFGDASYGIYLSGAPIQQLLFHWTSMSAVPLFLLSALMSLGYGLFSWHLLEQRALSLKRLFGPKAASSAPAIHRP